MKSGEERNPCTENIVCDRPDAGRVWLLLRNWYSRSKLVRQRQVRRLRKGPFDHCWITVSKTDSLLKMSSDFNVCFVSSPSIPHSAPFHISQMILPLLLPWGGLVSVLFGPVIWCELVTEWWLCLKECCYINSAIFIDLLPSTIWKVGGGCWREGEWVRKKCYRAKNTNSWIS